MSKKLIDKDILVAIRSGKEEEKALETLYKILLPKVKGICKKYRANDVDAYDVFQESIIKLYDYIKKDKFNVSYTIEAFVLTIAKNKMIDTLRKQNNRSEVLIDEFTTPKDLVIDHDILLITEKKKVLEQIFSSIGERCKELLLLRKYDKRSMTEISQIMGFNSENSAKTQTYKCKQKLIKSLEDNPTLANEFLAYA